MGNRDCRLDKRAARARLEQRLGKRTAAAWPHQLEMAEACPAENLRLGQIGSESASERRTHPLTRPPAVQADKIDDDGAAKITQPNLPGDRAGGGEVCRKPDALWVSRLGSSGVDVDQDASPCGLEMDGPAARKRNRLRQRSSKGSIKVNRPFGFRKMLHRNIRESGAYIGNSAGLVDKNLVRRNWQRTREGSGKSCDRVDPGRRIKPRGPIENDAPSRSQRGCLGGGRFDRCGLQEPEARGTLIESGEELIAVSWGKSLATFEARTANSQLDEPPAQRDCHRYPGRLAALGFAANLHQYALALVEPLAA